MSSAQVRLSTVLLPNGVEVFYREAGSPSNPTILLLHGFPNSSFYFRNLIPMLANKFHLVAPDLPGFGFTHTPAGYVHTFANMGATMEKFVDAVLPAAPAKFSMFVFDYGAPAGLRMALKIPERIDAIITQNGNAYEAGLGDIWAKSQTYWNSPTSENREVVREARKIALKAESIRAQYLTGINRPVAPESYTLDAAVMQQADMEGQLDLYLDYGTNVAMYPEFQRYIRDYRPRSLAVWGKNDPYFIPPGAEAWIHEVEAAGAAKQDAKIYMLNTGHFALETHWEEIGAYIEEFFRRR